MHHDLRRLAQRFGVYLLECSTKSSDTFLNETDIDNIKELADTIEECDKTLQRADNCLRSKAECQCGDDGPCAKAKRIKDSIDCFIRCDVNWRRWSAELISANSQE